MHLKPATAFTIIFSLAFYLSCTTNESRTSQSDTTTASNEMAAQRSNEKDDLVKRGNYLVTVSSCSDCHSPKKITATGPIADSTKMLSGFPANSPLPPIDANALKPGQWALMAPDATAFVGPWGISYAANLTPDSTTGLGAWTEDAFIKTMRTGRHLGQPNGRQILPPMPWYYVAQMTDEDLRAVFAYLRSLPPINNHVPAPTPPNEIKNLRK